MNKNYMDRRFFVIDSENLTDVRTGQYGYYLDEDGITTDRTYTGGSAPQSGCGAYVLITGNDTEITVEQDYCGSYGLYLFQKGPYFALSNSFLYLVDYLKSRFPLSVNKDYMDYFLVADFASVAYGQTMIREISVLDRNAVVHINIHERTMNTEIMVPEQNKVELNSREGIRILDSWYERWTGIIRSIAGRTRNLTADLSGGFDSRITFMLLMQSGVDLNRVNICSIHDDRHTHKDDYEIASEIAACYGFELNRSVLKTERDPISLEESVSLVSSVSLCFTKQMNFLVGPLKEPRYRITGAGGATIREWKLWDLPVDEFLEKQRKRTEIYPPEMAERLAAAQDRVLRKAMSDVAAKYGITDLQSPEITPLLNKEDRVRNHFGKDAVETFFENDIKIMPLLDKDLHRIRLNDMECQDKDLLVSVIMNRYCPGLLKFRYDGNRKIADKTLRYGAAIAEKYPMPVRSVQPEGQPEEMFRIEPSGKKAIPVSGQEQATFENIRKRYMHYFNSYGVQRVFRDYFGEDVGRIIRREVATRTYNPLYDVYVTLAAVKILEDVRASRNCHGENVFLKLEELSRFRDPDPFGGNEKKRIGYWVRRKAKSGVRYAKKKVFAFKALK